VGGQKGCLTCAHVCQSIPQLRTYGTESRRRRTQEMESQKPRGTLGGETQAARDEPHAGGDPGRVL